MPASLALPSVGGWRLGGLPRLLAAAGVVVAVLLAAMSLPAFGLPAGVPSAVAVTALALWMAAAGVDCLRRRGGVTARLTAVAA